MKLILISGLLLLTAMGNSQDLPPVSAATDYARLHLGLNSPKLLHSVDPEYTPQALAAGIEGSLVLEAVINKAGGVAFATVLSPLPAGLDRKALAAVKQWRYSPGVMDAEVVPVLMTIDVLFRLPYKPDETAIAARQKAFKAILSHPQPSAADTAELKQLAVQNVAGAIGLLGQWKLHGAGVPKDTIGGMQDIQRAAAGNDARSLLFLGLTRRAAFMGSQEAQQILGDQDERAGKLNEARWYFRMCAAPGNPVCEYRLGKLMVAGPGGTPNDFVQGVAWLELSKEHGDALAAKQWQDAVAKLSSIQLDWVAALKPHLELRAWRGF